MDLDRLPHFSSQPQQGVGRTSATPRPTASGSYDDGSSAALGGGGGGTTPRPRSSKAGDWRLLFPHTEEHTVPSYLEEFNDVKDIFKRKFGE